MQLTYNNYDTYFPEVKDVTTSEQAHNLAVEFSNWQPEQDLAMNEVAAFGDYFTELGKKFNLTSEFKENGII